MCSARCKSEIGVRIIHGTSKISRLKNTTSINYNQLQKYKLNSIYRKKPFAHFPSFALAGKTQIHNHTRNTTLSHFHPLFYTSTLILFYISWNRHQDICILTPPQHLEEGERKKSQSHRILSYLILFYFAFFQRQRPLVEGPPNPQPPTPAPPFPFIYI